MKISGREIIDVLEKYSVLDWYRYPNYVEDSAARRSATVVWRFDAQRTNSERITLIESAIRSALSSAVNVEWDLRYNGRNWILAPEVFVQLELTGKFKKESEVCEKIIRDFPSFFSLAFDDLPLIANAVEEAMRC
ncbi:hypothetical protein EJD96_16365 [Herbaspirillum seropedicae]|uniref:hypothetical protein n=1 Tax=Herbaspirillum seropedicae TaxID=964 RepID=UPI001121E8CA|nr:hypothetical protein [Herbaspirillum seropedicae]QDD65619.1 hypothetical protein EJD96_16365 [Herbaspirillum seropedicae]